jgi:hypothetical protein
VDGPRDVREGQGAGILRRLRGKVRASETRTVPDSTSELHGGAPLDDFKASISDAERMLALAAGLSDVRVQRMRADAKQTLGAALRVPSEQRPHLERAEGTGAWIIIKPGAELRRDMFGAEALKPLVRQSVVVIAAAVEAYVAERVNGAWEAMLATSTVPAAARARLARDVERRASAAPESIRDAFVRIGITVDLARMQADDGARASDVLGELRTMRNAIAHGATARSPDVHRVRKLLGHVRDVIERLDSVVGEELAAAQRAL